MTRTFAYAELLLIGISATTISAAVVGDPLPVVGPAVAAGLLVAGHHVHHRERGDGAVDEDDIAEIAHTSPENTRVYSDDESDGPSGSGRRPGRGDDRGDDLAEQFGDGARADGGRR